MNNKPLEISIKPDALFDYAEEYQIYKKDGVQAYNLIQQDRMEEPAAPGAGFGLINKLLALNSTERNFVKIHMASWDDPVTGMRAMRSAEHYNLKIKSRFFYNQPWAAQENFENQLFLSNKIDEVATAAEKNILAAYISPCNEKNDMVKIAFDGNYINARMTGAAEGDFLNEFIDTLHELKSASHKIRIGLILEEKTNHSKAIFELFITRGLPIDEMFFLAGESKKSILNTFAPDIYFYHPGEIK